MNRYDILKQKAEKARQELDDIKKEMRELRQEENESHELVGTYVAKDGESAFRVNSVKWAPNLAEGKRIRLMSAGEDIDGRPITWEPELTTYRCTVGVLKEEYTRVDEDTFRKAIDLIKRQTSKAFMSLWDAQKEREEDYDCAVIDLRALL